MGSRIKGSVSVLLLAPLMCACVIYDSTGRDDVSVSVGPQRVTAQAEALETLSAARFEAGGVIIRVGSNGCTRTQDFAVEVETGATIALTFNREQPDVCRAFLPEGVELRWSYEELGLTAGQAVAIRNPVQLP